MLISIWKKRALNGGMPDIGIKRMSQIERYR
jgi:hypothetical protein